MSVDLLQNAKNAIAALSSPSETQKANEWLVEFEKSTDAWQIAEQLVREPNGSPCRFFGAKFLYSKIQRQYVQLDAGSVASLTQTIVQHILTLSNEERLEINVCRYLCLSLAVLALQINQVGIISQILVWLNPIISTSPAVLLELLQALPEEAYNRQVDVSGTTRDLFIRQLSDSSNDVLVFLSSLWSSVGGAVRSKILVCAEKWIRITRMQSSSLLSQPIFGYILQSMSTQETFESAADAVIAIVQRFQCREPAILQAVLPVLLNLRGNWTSVVASLRADMLAAGGASAACLDDLDEDQLNLARTICRVFTEVAESCKDLFVCSAYAEAMALGQQEILAQLLECCKFSFDATVARIPLKFFYELSCVVKEGRYAHYEDQYDCDPYAADGNASFSDKVIMNHDWLKQRYSPVFAYLLDVALEHVVLSEEMLLGKAPLPEDTIDIRLEWKETVLDCCTVVGGEACLELLCSKLQVEIAGAAAKADNKMDWAKVESLLFCVQTIGAFLPRTEDKFISQIITFASSLPEHLVRLHVTVVELLGRLAFWIEANPSHLPLVLAKLFRDLQHEAISLVASKAIMSIFRHCNRLPNIPVMELHSMILQVRSSPHGSTTLSLESELYLLESIAVVITKFPTAESEAAFTAIMLPVATALNEAVSSGGTVSAATVIPHITRLTVMFRFYYSEGNVVTQVFLDLIPLFQRVLQSNSAESICEKLSSCYKHALRSCKTKFIPHLSVLTTHLSSQFAVTPFSAFLYAASVCVSSFGTMEQGALVPLLYQMIWAMSSTFFTQFRSLAEFEQRPDVVEEYFFLLAKALQYCPAAFIEATQESHTVLQAALTGLSLRHREAQKGILLFFEKAVQLATFWPEGTALQVKVMSTIRSVGASLVLALFSLLTGQMPAYAIDESNGCISDVLWTLKKRFGNDFQNWLAQSLQQLPPDAQTIATKSSVGESLVSSNSQKDFTKTLDRFERSCRRCL